MYIIHSVKGCSIIINEEEVDGVEPGSIIFAPEMAKIVIRNRSKSMSAVMKIQFAVYGSIEMD